MKICRLGMFVACMVALLATGDGVRPALADSIHDSSAPQYYVALGDSFAFGYRPPLAAAELKDTNSIDPSTFNTGYVDNLGTMLNLLVPQMKTVNFSCPTETTATYLSKAGCAWHPLPLHTGYSGSQSAAALAFLQAQPHVKVITISLGLGDLIDLTDRCQASDSPCSPQDEGVAIGNVETNLAKILSDLRNAAPQALILVAGYPSGFSNSTDSDAKVQDLDGALSALASTVGAIYVAPPSGDSVTPAITCSAPLPCTVGTDGLPDLHPTTAGYALMADNLYEDSGYTMLGDMVMVGFDSAIPGDGKLIFGEDCTESLFTQGLIGSATNDLHRGTTTHDVLVTTNDLPSWTLKTEVITGAPYDYRTFTIGAKQIEADTNNGDCWNFTTSSPNDITIPMTASITSSPLHHSQDASIVAVAQAGVSCIARVTYNTGSSPAGFPADVQTVSDLEVTSWTWHVGSTGSSGMAIVSCWRGSSFTSTRLTFQIR